MLDAKADGKWLGLDSDALGMKHGEDVAGAMAHRQDHMIGGDLLAALKPHALHRAVLEDQLGDFALEAIFAAQSLDGGAQRFHHGHQPEGADMGMGLGENVFRRARLHEFVQHFAAQMAGILDLAVELAVGESARAAFAELHIGFRGENVFAP